MFKKIATDSVDANAGWSTHPAGSHRVRVLERQIRVMRHQQVSAPTSASAGPTEDKTLMPQTVKVDGWNPETAWQEILGHPELARQLKQEMETLPARDPQYEENQEVLSGRRSAHRGQLIKYNEYTRVYARLLKELKQEVAGYDLLFDSIRVYPGYTPKGDLAQVTLCNQATYPRVCCTGTHPEARMKTWSLETSNRGGLYFSPDGKFLGHSRDDQTYDSQGQVMLKTIFYQEPLEESPDISGH